MTMAQTMLTFESLGGSSYGSGLLLRLLFLEFMVHLDRAASENHREYVPTSPSKRKNPGTHALPL